MPYTLHSYLCPPGLWPVRTVISTTSISITVAYTTAIGCTLYTNAIHHSWIVTTFLRASPMGFPASHVRLFILDHFVTLLARQGNRKGPLLDVGYLGP